MSAVGDGLKTRQSPFPSPLAGEGAERGTREAGEGAPVERARRLRRDQTDAERKRKLWFALRDRRFAGVKFRRQVPIEHYIADFACYEVRLIVELDGGQHAESKRDEKRDRWFAENGFRVLRFWNNDVLSNLNGVLERISADIAKTPRPAASPPPSPARGEGKEG